jgi:[acyl-carrier-protein] S-malonyltransferase
MTKRLGVVFPGQGSQKVGMGKDIFDADANVRALFETASKVLGRDFAKLCFEGPEEELTRTVNAQPAIFLVSAAMLRSHALVPSCVAGHSLGEITAYFAAGVVDFENALKIIDCRARAMGAAFPSEKSAMAAVIGVDAEAIEQAIRPFSAKPVVIANYNCPGQIVISGEKSGVESASEVLKTKGGRVIPLKVSGAFHSPLMQKGAEELKRFLAGVAFADAKIPVILNRTAKPEQRANELKENLAKQVVSPVQWIDSMKTMVMMADEIIECGPGKVLTNLNKKIFDEVKA